VEAAESLKAVSDATWRELLARTTPKSAPPPDVKTAASDLCSARAAWLEARAASDVTTQTRVVRSLSDLFRQGTEEGWGRNSDILVVVKKLADAMAAGDVATVQATPAGGCP
ncbi:MAG: hypothetical protein ACRD2W_25240, partial [Acidimicrobiales bacterium]